MFGRLAPWLIAACALLPYLAVRNYPHVHDDHLLRGPTSLAVDERVDWGTLLSGDFFGTFEQPTGNTAFWRPLVLATYRWEHQLAGESSAGFAWLGHVVTLLCHLAASLGLWRLVLALGLGPPSALLAAALFALHPLHVESVAWISGRTDVLATALCWWGTAWWIERKGSWPAAVAAVLAFVAALLSKEPALVLVGSAALLARCQGMPWRRALAAPALAIVATLILRAGVFGLSPQISEAGYMGPESPAHRWWTWAAILPDMLRFTVWPDAASPIHPVAAATGWGSPGVLAGLAALLLVVAASLWTWRRREAPLVLAATLTLGTLLVLAPWTRFAMGFDDVAGPLYDRYLYAMAAAPGLILCTVLARWLQPGAWRSLLAVALCAVTLGPATARRTQMWASEESFSRAGLAVAPGSANMWTQLGSAQLEILRNLGEVQAGTAAVESFEQALALDPQHRFAALNRFITLAILRREPEARAAAEALLAQRGTDPGVLHNVAGWHASRGRFEAAAQLYERELMGGSALPGAMDALNACVEALAAERQAATDRSPNANGEPLAPAVGGG